MNTFVRLFPGFCSFTIQVIILYFCVFCVGPFVSPEEVVARLIQVGLFDKAIDTALCFEIPVDSIFEALSSRYVLSVYVKVFSVINPLLVKKSHPNAYIYLLGSEMVLALRNWHVPFSVTLHM